VTAADVQVALIVLHKLMCGILQKCSRITVETMAVEEQYLRAVLFQVGFSFARFNTWLLFHNLKLLYVNFSLHYISSLMCETLENIFIVYMVWQ